jgi:2-iminobutanoate/2-iminopropanoate deaminase
VFRHTLTAIGILAVITTSAAAQSVSPNGVKTLSPAGAIKPTGMWDLATRAGDFIYIAGMRGIEPTSAN